MTVSRSYRPVSEFGTHSSSPPRPAVLHLPSSAKEYSTRCPRSGSRLPTLRRRLGGSGTAFCHTLIGWYSLRSNSSSLASRPWLPRAMTWEAAPAYSMRILRPIAVNRAPNSPPSQPQVMLSPRSNSPIASLMPATNVEPNKELPAASVCARLVA